MSGKAYTMREMKAIVDYLIENRGYGELRGRKMWMNFANSKHTSRTWQSLKETFLKRILPDITNPYFKLSIEQIASFQQGTDLEAKINNKLEIQTIHDDSSDDTNKTDLQPEPNKSKGTNNQDEDILSSKIDPIRSSTDTVVIGQCYNSAEEIQKDLESPNKQIEDDDEDENPTKMPASTKSIRDFITYSEPLTPMLQEVLHDFASEDEGDEPQMQIVEYPESSKTNNVTSPIEILDTENNESSTENNEKTIEDKTKEDKTKENKTSDLVSTENAINDTVLPETDESDPVECVNVSEQVPENTSNEDNIDHNATDAVVGDNHVEKNIRLSKSQNDSNSITDTLPNNQEALVEILKTKENSSYKQHSTNENINDTRKSSQSRELAYTTPKKNKSSEKTVSDRNITPQKPITSRVSFTDTELVDHANIELEKTNNHKVVNLDMAHNVISETHEISEMPPIHVDHTYTVLDESLSEKQEIPQDISIKTDEDEVARTSEDKELFDARIDARTQRKSTMQNFKSGYIKEIINEVVILKSQSDSSDDHGMVSPKKSRPSHRAVHNIHRDRALANVFGFSHGVKSNHTRHKKNVKRLSSQRRNTNTSSSDEWTSDAGPQFVSPPRGRMNKQSRKYLKPKAARILSLDEEGGLFVMYGKKIYPVVKDGKLVKNYLTYTPDNESDDEMYWKSKYVEEKKKTDELTKLLKHKKSNEVVLVDPEPVNTPAPETITSEKPLAAPESSKPDPPKEVIEKPVEQIFKEPEKIVEPAESKTVKIQFMKDNESVQLEGHWTHIQPVLEQVVQILHKEPAADTKQKLPEKRTLEREASSDTRSEYQSPVKKLKLSRDSTPISTIHLDDDVSDKINKMEEEIYMTIQERDLAESKREEGGDVNVTKRKAGRPPRSTSAANKAGGSSATPPKRKPSVRPQDEATSTDSSVVTRQRTRTPQKANDKEPLENVVNDGRRSTRLSSRSSAREDNSDVKYKFPSPPQAANNKNKLTKRTAAMAAKRKYPIKIARIFSSPDNVSIDSIESTQGYQDSDESHLSICLRKKRKLSLPIPHKGRNKTQRAYNRKLQRHTPEDMSSDSNMSFVTAPLKPSSQQSSSLNTEVYRSESYQMLFPQKQHSIQHLEKIEENNNDTAERISFSGNENNSLSPAFDNDGENSSNVTLPPSPVLSIVEKLSLSKSVLENTKGFDIPNDNQEIKQTMLNDYMVLDVDMSVPLMEQKCNIQKSHHNEKEFHFDLNMSQTSHHVSDSLLNKVCAVNIAEPTLSESIHHKLNNLLLESAKKVATGINKNNDKDKANMMEISEPQNLNKPKPKKRCSTPRKRQNKKSSKVRSSEPHIEQEHIESCENEKVYEKPKLIVTKAVEETGNVVTTDISIGRKSDRLRKKKDVIKVKISKPKMKKKGNSSDNILQNNINKEVRTSIQADSGINDTESGIFLRGLDDSVDLIHNHSDTCLQTHDCIGDSLEIIDDNAMSIISLDSNSVSVSKSKRAPFAAPITDKLLDICCENAQDLANLYKVSGTPKSHSNENSCTFKHPAHNISPTNSLLTDDLSDEISPPSKTVQKKVSKWYLLSEDEASNTNNLDIIANVSNCNSGYGANLQEIFPITCAVPDLSTITEENTAKFFIDTNSKSPLDSQSLPNL